MTEDDTKNGTESEINNIQIRQNLVETAVNFLLNPSVKNKPDHTKVAFLKNKGLTDPEISDALLKVQSDPRLSSVTQQYDVQKSIMPPPTQPYVPKTRSFWSRLSSVSSSLIVIAVALYGLHRFYKLYIEPWLFGTKPESDEMKELILELSNSVVQLKNSVSSLEFTINYQKEQIDRIFLAEGSPYMPVPMAVAELKTEIGNVKSLLINRHQFPAVPKVVSHSIPVWQLSDSNAKVADGEFKSDDETSEQSLSPEPPGSTESGKLDGKSEGELILDRKDTLITQNPTSAIIENGMNGVHVDDLAQSTSAIEDEEKRIPLETADLV